MMAFLIFKSFNMNTLVKSLPPWFCSAMARNLPLLAGGYSPQMSAKMEQNSALSSGPGRPSVTLWLGGTRAALAPTPWGWLCALTVIATVLRAIALNQQLWFDEIVALVNSVRMPLGVILTTYTSQNQHTLYSILARGSIFVFGEHPWTLRLPAVMFGVASIPALYSLGRLVTAGREALLAAALLVVSYHHVWFSQNARGYTAMLFWTLLATYLFLRGVQGAGYRIWIAYGIVMTLGLYTHLTMSFVAVSHALIYLWLVRACIRNRNGLPRNVWLPLLGFLLTGLLTLALYAPLLPQLLAHTVVQNGPAIHWEWKNPLWLALATLRGLRIGAGGSLLVVVTAGLIAFTGLASYWRQDRHLVGVLLLPVLVTAVVMLALEHNLWPRFFFFAIGFAFLLLVRGAMVWGEQGARLVGRSAPAGVRWGTVLVALTVVGSAWSLPTAYRYPKQDFLGAMRLVDAQRQPSEPVVVVGLSALPYQNYYRRDWRAVASYEELESVRSQAKRTWLVYTLPVYLKARYPDIWNGIQTEFTTVQVFRGTLGDGEVYVCQAPAVREQNLAKRREP